MGNEGAEENQADEAAAQQKDKMREALEKKQAKQRSGADHLSDQAKASHASGRAGGSREFRRKSGG